MANPYSDPNSIDYVLLRAQDDLRRGESQHQRTTEAQYTSHVKELLGNLERYLETCGVQLPADVLTGADDIAAAAVAAAAAATTASAASQTVAAAARHQHTGTPVFGSAFTAQAGAATVATRPSLSESVPQRAGWGTLATPTEAQYFGPRGDACAADFSSPAAAGRSRLDTSMGAATGGLLTSIGSTDAHSPVSPVTLRLSRGNNTNAVAGSSALNGYDAPAVAARGGGLTTSMAGGGGVNARRTLAEARRTSLTESIGEHSGAQLADVAAAARANAVAVSDPWGEFGQFVQSITDSKLNSNLTSLQSAAAATFPIPATTANLHAVNNASARSQESGVASTPTYGHPTIPAAVGASTTGPSAVFQLPHVLVTASNTTSPVTKDLHQHQPFTLSQQQRQGGGPYPRVPSPPIFNPSTASATATSGSAPPFASPPQNSTDEITSISSHSPSIGVQAAAYGAGSNAVRALGATAAPSKNGSAVQAALDGRDLNAATTPALEERRRASAPVGHVPVPPVQPRHVSATTATAGVSPLERAASMPAAAFLSHPQDITTRLYPHILRVSNPGTPLHLSVVVAPSAVSSVCSPFNGSAAAPPNEEKEALMRRLRGVLDRPSLVTSPLDGRGGAGSTTPPISQPLATEEEETTTEERGMTVDGSEQQGRSASSIIGAPYVSSRPCSSSPASPVLTQHPAYARHRSTHNSAAASEHVSVTAPIPSVGSSAELRHSTALPATAAAGREQGGGEFGGLFQSSGRRRPNTAGPRHGSSYTTADSTLAPTYLVNTVGPSITRTLGLSIHSTGTIPLGPATATATATMTAPAAITASDMFTAGLTRSDGDGYSERRDSPPLRDVTRPAGAETGSWAASETSAVGEKRLLMQRLRSVLSRSGE